MPGVMRTLYSTFIHLYLLGIRFFSLFSGQARRWITGRRDLWNVMEQHAADNRPLVWFHCASLGEFEQGKPLIDLFKHQFPAYRILLTFFSPSGYEVRKDHPCADHVHYMPADTLTSAKRFLDLWNPSLAVFIKYEYWYNHIYLLNKRAIPSVVVSAIFRPQQHFFRFYGRWFRNHLKKMSHFFVQNQESLDLLHSIGIDSVTISGDTRFDRVLAIKNNPQVITQLEHYFPDERVLVAGSTWEPDELLLHEVYRHAKVPFTLILAPHQVDEAGIQRIMRLFGDTSVRFSDIQNQNRPPNGKSVVVVDKIGLLSSLYQYGQVAYIGGGFGKGIHNILEAGVFGLPLLFGPNYKRFAEAVSLVKMGGAFVVNKPEDAIRLVNELNGNDNFRRGASDICRDFVETHAGATLRVIKGLSKNKIFPTFTGV